LSANLVLRERDFIPQVLDLTAEVVSIAAAGYTSMEATSAPCKRTEYSGVSGVGAIVRPQNSGCFWNFHYWQPTKSGTEGLLSREVSTMLTSWHKWPLVPVFRGCQE